MEAKIKIGILFIIIVFGILLAVLISYQPQPKEFVTNRTFETRSDLFFYYEITKYPSSAEVLPIQLTQERLTIGVVLDPWNLNFGTIPAGNNFGTRFINLVNKKENDVKIRLKVYGNITPFVNFSKNNFILLPKENVTLEVHFYAATAKIGNYSGEIDIVAQRPKYGFLYSFWG
ncbi:MAG: hypothetical protein QXO27_03780 [Candidatus Aenigmatarchaeota archaeon]